MANIGQASGRTSVQFRCQFWVLPSRLTGLARSPRFYEWITIRVFEPPMGVRNQADRRSRAGLVLCGPDPRGEESAQEATEARSTTRRRGSTTGQEPADGLRRSPGGAPCSRPPGAGMRLAARCRWPASPTVSGGLSTSPKTSTTASQRGLVEQRQGPPCLTLASSCSAVIERDLGGAGEVSATLSSTRPSGPVRLDRHYIAPRAATGHGIGSRGATPRAAPPRTDFPLLRVVLRGSRPVARAGWTATPKVEQIGAPGRKASVRPNMTNGPRP